jgi:hypothetical protein
MQRKMQPWMYLIAVLDNGKIESVDDSPLNAGPYHDLDFEREFFERVGEDGWEFVASIPTPISGRTKLYFKQPILE